MADTARYSSESALTALLAALDEAVFVFDEALTCRGSGARAAALIGLEAKAALGKTRAEILTLLTPASPEHAAKVASLAAAGSSASVITIDTIELGGRTLAWTSAPILEGGAVAGRVEVIREVSLVDDLTGLPNRRRFEEECEREHRRAQRAWEAYAVARVYIDAEKRDDSLVRLVGDALRASRRQYDIVARWDNEDFAVLLPCVDKTAASTVMTRAIEVMVAAAKDAGFPITVSAGVAVWSPPSAESATDVISRAASALAAARQAGGGAVHVDAGGAVFKDEPTEG